MTEELSEEDKQILNSYIGMNYPQAKDKTGLFELFDKIIASVDTSKTSNLDSDELNSVRNLKRGELFAKKMDFKEVEEYLKERSEIILGTALSKEMALIKAVITTKKESKASLKTYGGKKKWLSSTKEETE